VTRGAADRLAAVRRVRKVQEDVAAGVRQRAEQARAVEEARVAARTADVTAPWPDRALVELSWSALDRAEASLGDATVVAGERKAEHIAAVQRTRAMDRLVERRRTEANAEALRKAAVTMDDLATVAYARKQAEAVR
jgi:hypothetical protein